MANAYNETIEIAPISCLLRNPSLYPVIEDTISRKSFGWPSFGLMLQVYKDLVSDDILPDKLSVIAELERREQLSSISIPSKGLKGKDAIDYMENLADVNPDNIESYAYQVQRYYSFRQLQSTIDKIKSKLDATKDNPNPLDILSELDIETGKIAIQMGARSQNIKLAKDVALTVINEFKEATAGKSKYISTGLSAWDDFTNGLYPGRLYIVAAVSNDGKSSLVQNILYNISVEKDIKGCLISLEAEAAEVYRKIIQRITGISALRIESGDVSEEELPLMKNAVEKIGRSQIIFDDSSELILPLLRTKIRKAVSDGAKYVIVDQLEQILLGSAGDTKDDHIKLNFISYRIKAFAREMDIPIILVHQMNRSIDSGQNRGKNVDPQIQDLSQAGEKAADAVLMIRHKKNKQVILETYFWWVKHRQGRKGVRKVDFIAKNILFKDIPGQSEFDDSAEYQSNDDDMPEVFKDQ